VKNTIPSHLASIGVFEGLPSQETRQEGMSAVNSF
jgi:hypothetical protein